MKTIYVVTTLDTMGPDITDVTVFGQLENAKQHVLDSVNCDDAEDVKELEYDRLVDGGGQGYYVTNWREFVFRIDEVVRAYDDP